MKKSKSNSIRNPQCVQNKIKMRTMTFTNYFKPICKPLKSHNDLIVEMA